MQYSSEKIRNDFINFFKDKEHSFIRSSPVLPIDDSTLLFTNAGMNQFKKIFLNKETAKFKRATNSQKCIRVSGKHNDLEEVGVDMYHHTFFEMLGNWSFGDYYKKEAIQWSWELLTDIWQLDKERLWITVYKDDDESMNLWLKHTDVKKDRILKFGDKDNFWEMGETGPCGPSSEIHYYIGDIAKQVPAGVNEDSNYRELWNLVFIEYNRNSRGNLDQLESKHVDTGLGLERILSTLNKVDDHYKTDLFEPIIEKVISISSNDYSFDKGVPHRVIADHLRMVSFSLSDGIMPSNEGRGYVVRRVLRRAARFGRVLGIKGEFLYMLVDTLVKILGNAYPELIEKKDHIKKVIKSEESSFGKTLDRGLQLFEDICENLKGNCIPGEDVFKLYDTYGFPVDLTELLAKEKNISIDKKVFKNLMDEQKNMARKRNKFQVDEKLVEWNIINEDKNSSFVGYEDNKIKTSISKYRKIKDDYYEVILEKTPFYAESGGQIGDSGQIESSNTLFCVEDTYYLDNEICHFGQLKEGSFTAQEIEVIASVDNNKRDSLKSNHTSTHLLHKALKVVLGNEVQQAGSLVSDNHLRFDFTYYKKVNSNGLNEIENIVNNIIRKNIDLETKIKNFEDAKAEGAVALFGEKYDDEVRIVNIEGFSKELCGGTHVSSTGKIGIFKIISESSLASGIRRIEALTGEKAFLYMRDKIILNNNIQNLLMCNQEDMLDKINSMNSSNKKLKKEVAEFNVITAGVIIQQSIDNHVVNIGKCKLLTDTMRLDLSPQLISDIIRRKLVTNSIALIGIKSKNKNLILCTITKDFSDSINAGNIIKKIVNKLNLKGGGSKFMAAVAIDDIKQFNKGLEIGKNFIIEDLNNYVC